MQRGPELRLIIHLASVTLAPSPSTYRRGYALHVAVIAARGPGQLPFSPAGHVSRTPPRPVPAPCPRRHAFVLPSAQRPLVRGRDLRRVPSPTPLSRQRQLPRLPAAASTLACSRALTLDRRGDVDEHFACGVSAAALVPWPFAAPRSAPPSTFPPPGGGEEKYDT